MTGKDFAGPFTADFFICSAFEGNEAEDVADERSGGITIAGDDDFDPCIRRFLLAILGLEGSGMESLSGFLRFIAASECSSPASGVSSSISSSAYRSRNHVVLAFKSIFSSIVEVSHEQVK